MPPKRRKANADAVPEPKIKKIKVEEGGGDAEEEGFEGIWEWEADGEVWTPFSKQLNKKINDAFINKDKQFEFEPAPKMKMIVKLEEGKQKNKKTGYERRVRCSIKDKTDGEYYIWEWEDEKSNWNPYPPGVNQDLENEHHSKGRKKSVKYCPGKTTDRIYEINTVKLKQTAKHTGVERKVQRTKLGPVDLKDVPEDDVKPSVSNGAEDSTGAGDASTSAGKSGGAASKSGKSAGKSAGKSGGKASKVEEETKSVVRKIVKKGEAPVDEECPIAGTTHIYVESKDIWDCMLNQTNLGNNNNKYYLIQLLEEDANQTYYCWQRWGRVGYKGQSNLIPCEGNLMNAKTVFCKKFKDKTQNDWDDRAHFEKVSGKYDLIAMDYAGMNEDEVDAVPSLKKEDSDTKYPDSTLKKPLQDLVELICDIKKMEEAVMEMKYDAKKAPLGKLTQTQIKAGYQALKVIEGLIDSNNFGHKLVEACNDFYTRIPHDFGFKTPPTIRTKPQVKEKLQLLEALGDIEIAINILKSGDKSENPIDRHYHSLKCKLDPLDKTHSDYQLCNEYLQTTHASTHNQYKMELLDVFICDKDGESSQFKDHGNRMLLWHGSRLTNWVGILSQGLRIAPPEAPVTGYMFGKGVYFADMSSKSANYCFTSRSKNIGLLLLCEVSLGNVNTLLNADYKADKLPAGKNSVLGAGQIAPDPSSKKTMSDGVVVPIGKGIDTKVRNPAGYTLNYNEYIVYDTKQIKMKYLLKVKFNYK